MAGAGTSVLLARKLIKALEPFDPVNLDPLVSFEERRLDVASELKRRCADVGGGAMSIRRRGGSGVAAGGDDDPDRDGGANGDALAV